MRAKIRPHNLSAGRKAELDRVAREYIQEKLDEFSAGLKWRMTRRTILAVCLVLSDQYGFGSKRCRRAVDGLVEILNGVADDVYEKGEIEPDGVDKVVDNMMAELADRGIDVAFEGDPLYDSIDKIKKRREKEIASGV